MTLLSLRRRPDAPLVIPLILAMLWPGVAIAQQPAMPQGAQVVAGAATVTSPSASSMVITQDSQRAIINWQDFSIGAGGGVDIRQPGAAAALLNRVTGGNLSSILGQLRANGQVYLLNPQGIVVGPRGSIDTAAFVGSTMNTSNEIFMGGGPMTFSGDSLASVINVGTIKTAYGDVILIAPKVANAGTIDAPQGAAALLAGTHVLYAPGGGSLLIRAPAPTGNGSLENSGVIRAAEVALQAAGSPYALAVNNTGAISATSISRDGGRIVLNAGAGDVSNSGALTAAGEAGGKIDVAGANVSLSGSAVLDVTGRTAGGAIRVGGGFRGQDPEIANASTTTVGNGVTLRADAIERGDGGTVAVWADDTTTFDGVIHARGGADGGNGGEAEVSGHRDLHYGGLADLTAPKGATGSLLLDPGLFIVDAAQATTIQNNLNTANVTIDTNDVYDEIRVNSAITNNTTTNTLTLDANAINVNAGISLPNGTVRFGASGAPRNSLTSVAGATIAADLISVISPFSSVNFAGPLSAANNGMSISQSGGNPGSFTATNSSNQIKNLYLSAGGVTFSGNLDIRSSVATTVSGTLNSSANVTVMSSGDLVVDDGCGGASFTVAGTTTLGSTGGVVDTNNALTLAGAGRKRIYSATTNAPFDVSGLTGFTQYTGVSFSNDPQTGNVIYIAAGTALPTLTITADNKSMVYGAFEPTYTASFSGGSASNLTSPVQFKLDRAQRDVGTYSIIPFGAASSSHTLSYVNGTLTVTPAPLLISGPTVSSPYGSALPVFTPQYSGFLLGDGPSVVSGLTLSTSATSGSPVGTYTIVPSGASASNYTISYANGSYQITPAVLRVTANNATRLYGATNPTFGASFSGLVNGDSPSVVSGLQFSTTAAVASPVGAYPITVGGGTAANYTLQYVPGTLSVNPAPLSVSSSIATIIYGQSAPALTTTANGLVAGDTMASLGVGYSLNLPPGTPVGLYLTTLTGSLSNYAVTYIPGAISIRPKGLVITANNFKRFQFVENPAFTGTVDGLFGSDQVAVTYSTTAHAGSAAGGYAITPTAADNPNYTYTYVPGTLTVEQPPPPPPVTVTVATEDGSPSLTGGQITLKPLGDLSKTPPPANDATISVAGPSLAAMLHNSTSVVNKAFAEYSKFTGDQSISQLQYLMNNNMLGANREVGKLLPFLIGQAKEIIDRDESTWTSEERSFVAYMTSTLAAQKKAAAEEAARQLDAWKKEQAVELSKNLGAAFSTVGIPPEHFLKQAQSGVALNQDNTAVVVGLAGTAAAVTAAAAAGLATGATVAAVKAIAPFVGSMAGVAAKAAVVASTGAALSAGSAATAAQTTAIATVAGSTAAAATVAVAVVVVAAVAAIVVKAVQVGQAQEYDKQMQAAVAAAQQPMTNADLKSLLSTDTGMRAAFMYLATSAANHSKK